MWGSMIVCGGENLIDVIETPAAKGARRFTAHVGGSPYNCSRAIARLGGKVGYLGTLSTDSFGAQLLGALVKDSVQHLGERNDAPTTLAMVTVEDGQPDYRFYREGTAERRVTREGLRAALPVRMAALHMGSIALAEGQDADVWSDLFVQVAGIGIFTSLDPNIRTLIADPNRENYSARLLEMARVATLIRLSDEDAAWWFPGLAPERAVQHLAALAPKCMVIVTQGAGEILCHAAQGEFSCTPPLPARLADTVGAGDTLTAAVLEGLARKRSLSPDGLRALSLDALREVVATAARAASITCSRAGCNPPVAAEVWPS